MASVVDDESDRANEALSELAAAVAQRQSLLAWTIRWCRDGEDSWARLWERATDAKSMMNVLVMTGAIDRVALRSVTSSVDAVEVLARRRGDASIVQAIVLIDGLPEFVRGAFQRPSLDEITARR